ncbi:hypothetical protein [Saliterribacillus persicus]|uniref:Uncharacterized protein n=1 Tax=Saliterribacillus persicus TaxID=930114 RepID=A0A368XIH9_9BACI|nr:hypothetical protein [Saliterribacillus persicus]RCW65804.1 hypothetical protein DFR57_11018 [Saliterribacillus persicus]
MKKTFELNYDNCDIKIENRWFSGEKLYIDDELQDENLGLSFRGTLNGVLATPTGEKKIKAKLGGIFRIHCKIFVDNKLIFPTEK